jgi:hypothetical protein
MQTTELQSKIYQANPTLAKRGISFEDYCRNPEMLWIMSDFVEPVGLLAQQIEVFRESWRSVK